MTTTAIIFCWHDDVDPERAKAKTTYLAKGMPTAWGYDGLASADPLLLPDLEAEARLALLRTDDGRVYDYSGRRREDLEVLVADGSCWIDGEPPRPPLPGQTALPIETTGGGEG